MDLAALEGEYAKLRGEEKRSFFERLRRLPASPDIVAFVRARILDEGDAAARELAVSIYLERTMKYGDDPVGKIQREGHRKLLADGPVATRKSVLYRLEGKTGHR